MDTPVRVVSAPISTVSQEISSIVPPLTSEETLPTIVSATYFVDSKLVLSDVVASAPTSET